MKKLITIGVALLLLGLIAGIPYRAMGAEEVCPLALSCQKGRSIRT